MPMPIPFSSKIVIKFVNTNAKRKCALTVGDDFSKVGIYLNGSFIRAGLVDEYKVLLMATIDGGVSGDPTKTSFDVPFGQSDTLPVDFFVENVEQIGNEGLLLTFVKEAPLAR